MNKTVLWIVGGVIGLGLIFALAFSIAGEQPIDTSAGFGDPQVSGDVLPVFNSDSPSDVAVGLEAPETTGADWNGEPVTIQADGTPKIILFLAHWCPHCQAEVPVVQQWLDAGNLPDGVDLVSVATLTNPSSTNWPPQDWLEEEGWTAPVIMDDEISSVANSYGLAGTPFYVVLDGDNKVVRRVSGEIGVAGLNQLVLEAQAAAALSG